MPRLSIVNVCMAPEYLKALGTLEQAGTSYAILSLVLIGGDLHHDVRPVSEAFE